MNFASEIWNKPTAAAAPADDVITKSVRFNRGDAPSIHFTPSSSGSTNKWTTAFWFKRSELGLTSGLFGGAGYSGNTGIAALYFSSDDDGKLNTYYDDSSDPFGPVNDRLYRDTAGWMQVIWAVDAANTEQRIWVNGVEETLDSSKNPNNTSYGVNYSGVKMEFGGQAWGTTEKFDGYIAQCVHLDGQFETDPTKFGQFSSTSGQWEPIELTSSSFTYGTNGALLEFKQTGTGTPSSTTIGADTSGKGNHWSVTNLAASDVVEDTPTDNYCTLNPLNVGGSWTLSEGNLKAVSDGSTQHRVTGTFAMASGKWYFECKKISSESAANYQHWGLYDANNSLANGSSLASGGNATSSEWILADDGDVANNGTGSASGLSSIGQNDIVQIAVDMDTKKFWVGRNNTWDGDPAAGSGEAYSNLPTLVVPFHHQWGSRGSEFNFGQSDFTYTPPSGFKALSTGNLATPTIAKPSEHFSAKTYTGNGTDGQAITVDTQPDLLWVFSRTSTSSAGNTVVDFERGGNSNLASYSTGLEATASASYHGGVSALDRTSPFGFTATEGSGTINRVNRNTDQYVAYAWKESVTAGFDIQDYTGTSDAGALDVTLSGFGTPEMVIVKAYDDNSYMAMGDTADDWYVWHSGLDSASKYILLNDSAGQADSPSGDPSISDVINVSANTVTVGGDPMSGPYLNENDYSYGRKYIIYAFKSIEGFSKVGSYEGTGSGTDLPFIYTGFKPAFVMVKNADNGSVHWNIHDAARDPDNIVEHRVSPNQDSPEDTGWDEWDFFSNGFRPAVGDSGNNGSGETHIYLAIAESPFKYSNAR